MGDTKPVADDVSEAKAEDVSEAEPSTDEVDATDLEDSDVSFDDFEDTDAEPEGEEPVATDDEPEEAPEEDVTPEEEPEEEQEKTPAPKEEPKEDPESKEESKEEPKEDVAKLAFEKREAERKLREERQAREAENLNRYIDEAADDEAEKAKRQNEVEAFKLRRRESALNEQSLEVEIKRAIADIDLFSTGPPEVKERLAKSLDMFEQTSVRKDKQGNIVEIKGDVYEYLKNEADSIRKLTGIGARQQGKQKSKQKARTSTVPTRTPKEPKGDPMLDGFDEEAGRW